MRARTVSIHAPRKTKGKPDLYKPKHRARGRIPWGWRVSSSDPHMIEPEPERLRLLANAFEYLRRGASFREVAAYLSKKSGKPLHHTNLYRMFRRKPKLADIGVGY
jgi:hypothetical protein